MSLSGRYDEAVAQFTDALALTWARGDKKLHLECLVCLGRSFNDQGRYYEAREVFQEAFAFAQDKGVLESLADSSYGLAVAMIGIGQRADIERIIQVGMEAATRLDYVAMVAGISTVKGVLDFDSGSGWGCLDAGIGIARRIGNPWVLAAGYMARADCYLSSEQFLEAQADFACASLVARDVECPALQAAAEFGLARTEVAAGDPEKALLHANQVLWHMPSGPYPARAQVELWLTEIR
jgi:tetratricopeptide (TPR) repeat protein